VYRAADQHGQVIDVFVSKRRNVAAATKFFEMMLAGRDRPTEVTTDLAAPYCASSTTCSQKCSMTPPNMRTVRSSAITDGSRHDCVQCAVYEPTGPRRQ
jgi:transposase-like protein